MNKINQVRQSLERAMCVLGAFMLTGLSPVLLLAGRADALVLDGPASQQMPGTVISSRSMILNDTLSRVATGKRIVYISTDTNGNRIDVSGVVLTPRAERAPAGQRNIVAWAHGTAGIADRCAPSNHSNLDPDPSYQNYANAVASYLTSGWTVAATDYPGLGVPGEPLYLNGDSEARAVIDSVRAARYLDSSLSNKWVAVGHSQGGQAALFASELAGSYGTDFNGSGRIYPNDLTKGANLHLMGAVGIAPVSNFEYIAPYVPGTAGNGYVVMALYGLAATDPEVIPANILAQPALDRAGVLATGCYPEILGAYYDLSAEQLLVGGALPENIIAKMAAVANPAQAASKVPVMMAQGEYDAVVPVGLTQLLQSQVCSYGTPVQLNVYPGDDHDSTVRSSMTDVKNYISDRFANKPAPSNCQ